MGFDPHDSRQKRLIGELLWLPAFAQGKLRLVGKWLYDLEATNRRKVDYGQVTIGDTF